MNVVEVRACLLANIDAVVHVTWTDGDKYYVKVLTVDDEGFVYDLVPPDPRTPYWNTFEDVIDVEPPVST